MCQPSLQPSVKSTSGKDLTGAPGGTTLGRCSRRHRPADDPHPAPRLRDRRPARRLQERCGGAGGRARRRSATTSHPCARSSMILCSGAAATGSSSLPEGCGWPPARSRCWGLQEQTRAEVSAAADGERLLRLAVSSLFAEYSAPGLIEAFTTRARDLRVELAVHPPDRFAELLAHRSVDLAIGPRLGPRPRLDRLGALRALPDRPGRRPPPSPRRSQDHPGRGRPAQLVPGTFGGGRRGGHPSDPHRTPGARGSPAGLPEQRSGPGRGPVGFGPRRLRWPIGSPPNCGPDPWWRWAFPRSTATARGRPT